MPLTTSTEPVAKLSESFYKLGYGVEIGNYFRIADLDNMAIGLKATWFSAAFNAFKDPDYIEGSLLNLSSLNIGSYYTYAINEDMGLTAYYQVAPNTALSLNGDFFLGINNKIGVNYQYRIFTAGLEFQIGNMKDTFYYGGVTDPSTGLAIATDPNFAKIYYNNLRLNLGFKF